MSTTALEEEMAAQAAAPRPAARRPGTPFPDPPRHRPGTPFPEPSASAASADLAPADAGRARTLPSLPSLRALPSRESLAALRSRSAVAALAVHPAAVFAGLYLLAVAIMLIKIGSRPGSPYNWENYTVRGALDFLRDPNDGVLKLRDGLMTDSGRTWPTVLPIWLGMKLGGVSLAAIRVPIVLIAALSVPLTWVFGRRVASPPVALAAAGLVLFSPVFLLYGRTATVVGMSLTPALVGMILLHGVLTNPRSWRWLAGLNLTLVLSGYGYGPIRFLWLIALGLLVVEIAYRRELWRPLATCFAVTLVVFLASAVTLPRADPGDGWLDTVKLYYNGRGEQIFALNEQPEGYGDFLRQDDAERAANEDADAEELATKLILQNARDLRDLLLDRDTRPAVTDYWNPDGRLQPGLLVPLFLFGMVLSLLQLARSTEQRMLQALLWGFSLPLLLTSKVHIGRLIFIVPVVALLTALPLTGIIRWLASRQRPADRAVFLRQGSPAVAGLLVLVGAGLGWADWGTEIPRTGMAVAIEQIDSVAAERPDGQLAYVFGDDGGREIELLNVGELELALHDRVRFADIRDLGDVRGGDGPLLVYGGLLSTLGDPALLPGYCDTTYLLAPGTEDRFHDLTDAPAEAACAAPLTYELLP